MLLPAHDLEVGDLGHVRRPLDLPQLVLPDPISAEPAGRAAAVTLLRQYGRKEEELKIKTKFTIISTSRQKNMSIEFPRNIYAFGLKSIIFAGAVRTLIDVKPFCVL